MKLKDLYDTLAYGERKALAERVGISAGYLWQIAKRWRARKASVDLIRRLVEVEPRLTVDDLVSEMSGPADQRPSAGAA